MKLLADKLRSLRLEKKLTQEQLAERLGVSAQSVSRWETCATYPDVMLLPRLAELFGVLVDELFRSSPKGYAHNAQRLLAVYEHSHRPEDFLAAAEEYEKIFRAGTATADDWRSYGVLHEYMAYHCIKKATGSFHQAMDISRAEDPEMFHRTLRQSILLRCRTGQAQACIREQEECLSKGADQPQVWVDLAHAYFYGGQPDKALQACERALEQFPQEGVLHVYAGDACRALKQYDRAFAHWEQAVKMDTKFLDAMYSMAFCRGELGQFDRASVIWEDIARRLVAMGLEEEAQMPRSMAEKCRERLFK